MSWRFKVRLSLFRAAIKTSTTDRRAVLLPYTRLSSRPRRAALVCVSKTQPQCPADRRARTNEKACGNQKYQGTLCKEGQGHAMTACFPLSFSCSAAHLIPVQWSVLRACNALTACTILNFKGLGLWRCLFYLLCHAWVKNYLLACTINKIGDIITPLQKGMYRWCAICILVAKQPSIHVNCQNSLDTY